MGLGLGWSRLGEAGIPWRGGSHLAARRNEFITEAGGYLGW